MLVQVWKLPIARKVTASVLCGCPLTSTLGRNPCDQWTTSASAGWTAVCPQRLFKVRYRSCVVCARGLGVKDRRVSGCAAMVLLKKCTAKLNKGMGVLSAEIADAIIQAADEVLGGALEDNFLLVRVAFV